MLTWTTAAPAVSAAFLSSVVEVVEAFTIVLAVATVRGWRPASLGALDGSLKNASYRTDPYFGFAVPSSVPGVEPHLLYPMKTWKDKSAFDETARKLVRMFQENFVKYEKHVDADVRAAAPEVRIAAA